MEIEPQIKITRQNYEENLYKTNKFLYIFATKC
jgi:hypothetical protein